MNGIFDLSLVPLDLYTHALFLGFHGKTRNEQVFSYLLDIQKRTKVPFCLLKNL